MKNSSKIIFLTFKVKKKPQVLKSVTRLELKPDSATCLLWNLK